MIEAATISISITVNDRQQAYQFAGQQPTLERSEQVYRNTLAVLVTQRYLQLLSIDTDLELSHSWNPVERMLENIADLYIPSLQGYLECRSLRRSDRKCFFPKEVWTERLGYIIIQLDEPYQEGQIIGFVESVTVSELPRSYFQPLDELLDLLTTEPQSTVQLQQWLKRIFEADWQPTQELFKNMRGVPILFCEIPQSLRTSDELVKQRVQELYRKHNRLVPVMPNSQEALVNLIQTAEDDEIRWQAAELLWELEPRHPACPIISAKDLGIYLLGYPVVLMVGVLPKFNGEMLMILRVFPQGQNYHLPSGLKLIGLDETGNPFFQVESRPQDDYIQFKFTADPGDRFSALVVLKEASFTESFAV